MKRAKMDEGLPAQVNYWLTTSSKHDCFFVVGPEEGPKERIGALKIFLMGYSEPLRYMLEDSSIAETGDVRVVDIKPETFQHFLKCVYGSSDLVIKKLSFEEAIDLLYVLEKYIVEDLKPKVGAHLRDLLNDDPIRALLALANPVCLLEKNFEKALSKVVQKKTECVFSSELFLKLTRPGVLWILQQDSLNTTEMCVWETVLKWARHAVADGKDVLRLHIQDLLQFIRFREMNCEDFCKKVVPTDILNSEEIHKICMSFGAESISIGEKRSVCDNSSKQYPFLSAHVVSDIKALNGSHKLPTFKLDGFFWNLMVRRRENSFGLFLQCHGSETTPSWKIFAEADLVLVNQSDEPNVSLNIKHEFFSGEDDWGVSKLYPWDKVVSRSNGFIKNDSIIVMVNVQVTSKEGR